MPQSEALSLLEELSKPQNFSSGEPAGLRAKFWSRNHSTLTFRHIDPRMGQEARDANVEVKKQSKKWERKWENETETKES
jgi:hypothetical protein